MPVDMIYVVHGVSVFSGSPDCGLTDHMICIKGSSKMELKSLTLSSYYGKDKENYSVPACPVSFRVSDMLFVD